MRKPLSLLGASVAAAAMLVGAVGASPDARRSPALRLADRQPLVLRGVGFKSRELVRLRVTTTDERRAARRIRAGTAGAFRASFGPLALDRCDGLLASAVGARGSRAALELPQPACPPGP